VTSASTRSLHRLLREIYPPDRIAVEPEQRLVYECDGHTLARAMPDAVVFPISHDEVRETIRICARTGVPFVPRGAGTGLSGGAVAAAGGVQIETALMKRILSVDPVNRTAVVQPGLVNLHLSRAVAEHDLRFAPDPSSQAACTIGGNVAENSGGPHTLALGVTVNHVLGVTMILPDGETLRTGSPTGDAPGFDLTGVIVGSEGTFGVVTEVTVRLVPEPAEVRTILAAFADVDAASETVSDTIRSGLVPAAIELMDQLAVEAVERHLKAGYPSDAGAVLLIEIEGDGHVDLDRLASEIEAIAARHGATQCRRAADEAERLALWRGRKQALGAVGKIARGYYTHDGVVPRSSLPEALRRIRGLAEEHGLRVANVCHAGDGNLHPLLLFDPDDAEEVERVHACGSAILRACIDLGGTLTGEHGVGMEKRELMSWLFDEPTLDTLRRLRHAFDTRELANPAKVFPSGARCGEVTAARRNRTGGWI